MQFGTREWATQTNERQRTKAKPRGFAEDSGLREVTAVEEPASVRDEEGGQMAKLLRCSDVGFDCGYEIRADTEDEVMKKAAEHAAEVHGMKEISEEVGAKVRAAIKDE